MTQVLVKSKKGGKHEVGYLVELSVQEMGALHTALRSYVKDLSARSSHNPDWKGKTFLEVVRSLGLNPDDYPENTHNRPAEDAVTILMGVSIAEVQELRDRLVKIAGRDLSSGGN